MTSRLPAQLNPACTLLDLVTSHGEQPSAVMNYDESLVLFSIPLSPSRSTSESNVAHTGRPCAQHRRQYKYIDGHSPELPVCALLPRQVIFAELVTPSLPILPNPLVAALIITLWDHLITLDREVEYIWTRKWSSSKVLYLLARYFGDLLLISVVFVFLNQNAGTLFCLIGLKVVGIGSMVIILITQVIMQLRIISLYGPKVANVIRILWLIEVVGVVSLGVASLAAIDVRPYTLNTVRMCNPTYLPRFAFLFWVPVILFETFLFILAFRIAYLNWLEVGDWRGAALLHVVLRDNFQFFFLAFICYIITAATWLTADPRYFTVPGSFSCSLTAIMGCRLILNLCQAYHDPLGRQPSQAGSIWGATNTRTIRFAQPKSTQHSEWSTRTVDVINGRITHLPSNGTRSTRPSESEMNEGDDDITTTFRYKGDPEGFALQDLHTELDGTSRLSGSSRVDLASPLDEGGEYNDQLPPNIDTPNTMPVSDDDTAQPIHNQRYNSQ